MKKRRALLLTLAVVLALCVGCGLKLKRARQQYARDRELIAVLERDDTQAALALVNHGADPDARQTPMPKPTLPRLLARLFHPASPPVNDSPTALMLACGEIPISALIKSSPPMEVKENLSLLQAMLAHGAHVNATTLNARTALHCAIVWERVRTVELLLQQGANSTAQDKTGVTPLALARQTRRPDLVRLLQQHGAK